MAALSIEAFINEVFLMADLYFSEPDKVRALWVDLEREPTLEKFQVALGLKDKERMDKGAAIYQNADTLIKLRDALTHFKPEWSDEKIVHKQIEARIKSKFPLSPFFLSDSIFPEKCMTYGCAEWCISAAFEFVNSFCEKSSIENRYLRHTHHLTYHLIQNVAAPGSPAQ